MLFGIPEDTDKRMLPSRHQIMDPRQVLTLASVVGLKGVQDV
jgi:hypothetical protein